LPSLIIHLSGEMVAAGAAVLHLLGIAAAAHVLMCGRTAQGTIAWILSLVVLPYLALPLYLIVGGHKFRGYVDARRTHKATLHRLVHGLMLDQPGDAAAALPADLRALQALGGLSFTRGNDARLLINGEATFAAIFAGIDAAERYVLVQFFIIHDDGLGRALQQRLIAKARAGVAVYLLFDDYGAGSLPAAYLQALRAAGVNVSPFNGPRTGGWLTRRLRLNFRNHRKLVVVDGRRAWIGGHNVGDEYLGKNPRLSPWRDTHVEVVGPCVTGCQLSFAEDWYWATRDLPDLDWRSQRSESGDKAVLVLPSGPADMLDTCALAFCQAIERAHRRVWIVSPYFVPDDAVLAALQLAALRGVDVRVLLPARPDHLLVWLAGFSFLEETDGVGVKIHHYQQGFLHQKVMLVDDDLASVGTANFDNRSFVINFEVTLFFADRAFAAEVARMLEADFALSRRVSVADLQRRPLHFRVASRVSRLLAPLL
jgi:cardiolipin synthase A/B